MIKRNYLVGKRFGILTVLSEAGRAKDRHILYECVCECGNHKIVSGNDLLSSHTRSCGCRKGMKHGGSHDRLYKIWMSMHNRCKRTKGYEKVSICKEWHEYEPFKAWAYANGYDESAPKWQCTIDRINVDGNYAPDNCRWVNQSVQMFNRRKMHSKLGLRGVYKTKNDKYYAAITKNRKQIYLGQYDRIEDAVESRKHAELRYFGIVLEV